MRSKTFLSILLICIFSSRVMAQDALSNANQLINEASVLIGEGNYRLAIGNKLDPVINAFEQKYIDSKQRIYGARTSSESLYYLLDVAVILDKAIETKQKNKATEKTVIGEKITTQFDPGTGQGSSNGAIVIDATWGNALFMKGSALISLKEYPEAKKVLAEAVMHSPMNSMYLSEYAFVFIDNKEFEMGLELATKAEAAANFSPDNLKKQELGRAKRNIGYTLIELGRLDEAKKKFKECLKLDRNDEKAKNELAYIEQQEKKQKK